MTKFSDICLICLRTDKKLKTAPAVLSKYYKEISMHYVNNIEQCNYCDICEHLLRKAYKFHQKCLTAANILKSWANSMTSNNTPIDQLYLKLYPDTLGPWTANNNNKVYLFDEDSLNSRGMHVRNSVSTPVIVPKLEISPMMIPVVDIKEEVVEECALEEINIVTNVDPQDSIDNIVIKEIKHTPDTHSIEAIDTDIGNNEKAQKTDTNVNTSRKNNLKRNLTSEESDAEDDNIYLSDDDCNDDTIDEIEQPDYTSINNDHDYLAHNHTSDDDSVDSDDTTTQVDKTKPQALKFMSTLRNLNVKLEDICHNWEIPALTHMAEDITTEEVRRITREHLANKMLSSSKFRKRSMRFKMNAIDTDLSTILTEGQVQVRDFNADMTRREWLIWTVAKKMRKWDELKAEGGKIFDTEAIISCLDKISQKTVQHLHQYFSDKKSSRILVPEITRILTNIESKLKDDEYASVFEIQYLTTEKAKMEEFQQRKTYECYLRSDHSCNKCFIPFRNSGLLQYHVKTNHDESNMKYLCSICPVRRTSKERILSHIGLHDEVFKCKLCPLVTYYRKSMTLHYSRHKGTSHYNCEKCNKTFGSLSVFLTHNSKYHPRGAHICTICGGSYISRSGLSGHIKRKHPGATKDAMSSELKCETCNITFFSLEEYSEHSRKRHRALFQGMAKPYVKCQNCSLKFFTARERNKHAVSVHGVKEKDLIRRVQVMRCRVCGVEGNSAGWLMMHYAKQHPTADVAALYAGDKTHLCEICGKGFALKVMLRDHMNIHNGVTYPCTQCDKRFTSKSKLKRHGLTHQPPGFACKYCGKKFKSRPNLWSHCRMHIGDRRYKCDICGKGFVLNNALREHIRGVHKNERRIRKPRLDTRRTRDTKNVAETVDEVREAIDEVNEATYEVNEATYEVNEATDEVTEATDEVRETVDEVVDATEEFLESTDENAETIEEMEVIHEETDKTDDEEIQYEYEVLETEIEMIDEVPETSYGTNTTVLFNDIGEIGEEIEL